MKAAADSTGQSLQAEIDRARGLREDLSFLADRANALADQLETAITRSRPAVAASAGGIPAGSNVAHMPLREEPRPPVSPPQAGPPHPRPAPSTTTHTLQRPLPP